MSPASGHPSDRTRAVESHLAYQDLIHVVSGAVIRRRLRHHDDLFTFALPERDERVPVGACGIAGPNAILLVMTASEWADQLPRAEERAESWMATHSPRS